MNRVISKRWFHTRDIYVNTARVRNYCKKSDICDINTVQTPKTQELFQYILNDKISCLYYIELGSFADLYSTMNISTEQYSYDKFGHYRIGKFGLTNDISTRFQQHQNKKNGYGRWCKDVKLKWFAIIPQSQLSKAESTLSSFLKAKDFTFNYTDIYDKRHDELIKFQPSHERRVKKIYKQVLDLYSCNENKKIQKYQLELLEREYELRLRDEREKTLCARHQCEILKLQIQIAELSG